MLYQAAVMLVSSCIHCASVRLGCFDKENTSLCLLPRVLGITRWGQIYCQRKSAVTEAFGRTVCVHLSVCVSIQDLGCVCVCVHIPETWRTWRREITVAWGSSKGERPERGCSLHAAWICGKGVPKKPLFRILAPALTICV